MRKLGDSYIAWVEKYLPSPFVIALMLTGITFLLAIILGMEQFTLWQSVENSFLYWQKGFWELLAFTMQMTLILLLGHTLALTPFVNKIINSLADKAQNTAQAALIVSIFTLLASFLNWGLCLIFGAILSKKIADRFHERGKAINFGLLAATAYIGMMAWHGGLSGSAPLKVAEAGHFLADKMGCLSIGETIFSPMNLAVWLAVLVILPLLSYYLGKRFPGSLQKADNKHQEYEKTDQSDDLEGSKFFNKVIAGFMIISLVVYAVTNWKKGNNIIDLNFINFCLLSLSILLHKSFTHFFAACKAGIIGVMDVVIQFPFYAGIMGIMKYSGLVVILSQFFVDISNELSFPILTFFSAALVNFFVPSGGGQWAIQGPIVIESAMQLGISPHKIVMALAYGDQITNMLQPFWALPLLGITGQKAKDILPYTTIFFIVGTIIFLAALLIF